MVLLTMGSMIYKSLGIIYHIVLNLFTYLLFDTSLFILTPGHGNFYLILCFCDNTTFITMLWFRPTVYP